MFRISKKFISPCCFCPPSLTEKTFTQDLVKDSTFLSFHNPRYHKTASFFTPSQSSLYWADFSPFFLTELIPFSLSFPCPPSQMKIVSSFSFRPLQFLFSEYSLIKFSIHSIPNSLPSDTPLLSFSLHIIFFSPTQSTLLLYLSTLFSQLTSLFLRPFHLPSSLLLASIHNAFPTFRQGLPLWSHS